MDFMAAAKIVGWAIRRVGDAKAQNLQVRRWCYEKSARPSIGTAESMEVARRRAAEKLETWVMDVKGGLGRERREDLRIECYEAVPTFLAEEARLQAAADLYDWMVKAESLRPEPEAEDPAAPSSDRPTSFTKD